MNNQQTNVLSFYYGWHNTLSKSSSDDSLKTYVLIDHTAKTQIDFDSIKFSNTLMICCQSKNRIFTPKLTSKLTKIFSISDAGFYL